MRRLVTLAAVLLGLGLMAGPAAALPAPMSTSELLQKSDLVALVRIKSVTCTGVSKDDRTGEDLPSYSASAELMEVIKGEEVKGDTVDINFHWIPTGLLGPWTVYYYPGEMVWTHLVGSDGKYTTIWWNGRGNVVSNAVITAADETRRDRRDSQRREVASYSRLCSRRSDAPFEISRPARCRLPRRASRAGSVSADDGS